MAEELEQDRLDVAEFAATLLAEVRSGIAASRSETTTDHLEVVEAVVRVGEPAGRDPAGSPIVERSGAADSGWQIELVLRGPALHEATGGGGDDRQPNGSGVELPTAFALWRDRPLADLKGIDRVRTTRLGHLGVTTIGELLALDEEDIAEVARALRSRRYVDLWVQVALLQTAAPLLGPSRADGLRLVELAGRSPAELRAMIGPEVCSRSTSVQLFDLLAAFGAALDQAAMRSVTLRELRAATRR